MKLTKPFMTGFPGGGGSIPSGKGHLFGDALFNADFFQLQNTAGEEIIKYTKDGGLVISGDGESGDVVKIVYDEAIMSEEVLGVTVKAVYDAGKIPAIVWDGSVMYNQSAVTEGGYFDATFNSWSFNVTDSELVRLGIAVMDLQYTESDGWALQIAYKDINVGGN